MKIQQKLLLFLGLLSFFVLLVTLMDWCEENPLKDHKLTAGIQFMVVSGFVRQAFSKKK
ncbi:hypothetical protein LZZ90_04570 [Flavobacterium sp. SM15]|uniref:hypothetical protein n=1 Tax=Flavobacterium sp. SM15 TaxID=2908005 RepID=UPI001EDB45AC|nr:hypothetical protein [Flavobacterium sp. SM15]MCG2610774.1 hypothetical protein [Flavobacterium sp. SM15]